MRDIAGALLIIVVTLSLLFITHSRALAREGVKFFSLQRPDSDAMQAPPELNDSFVYGLSWRFKWMTIEPQEGQYNWALLDKAIELSWKSGKQVMLRVTAGQNTPEWVYQAGARAFNFTGQDLVFPKNHPESLKMPIPWEDVYWTKWERFIQTFGARYDGNPSIYSIQMTGGGHIGEMNLPKAYEKWQQVGYTDDRLIMTWKRIINAYQKALPHTPTNLDINEPMPKQSDVLESVVSYVLTTYPGKVFIQQNGLRANFPRDSRIRTIIRQASSKTIVGYQMIGGKGFLEKQTGDRLTAFRNALEDGASYIEVYASDVRDHAHRSMLQSLGHQRELR